MFEVYKKKLYEEKHKVVQLQASGVKKNGAHWLI